MKDRDCVRTVVKAFFGCVLFPTLVLAQTISNPSFEASSFSVSPGYVSANSPIPGWTTGDPAKAGLNPAGGLNTFANNGAVPNGNNVAFLLPTNWLSTTISGLTVGVDYTLKFRVNSQAGTAPTLRVAIDNNPSIFDAGGVAASSAAGVLNPYKDVAINFTATAASHVLYITNNAASATAALLMDDFRISVSNGRWSYSMWTNDASSGVDGSKTYTHAFAFNTSGASFTINNVPFTRLAGANPTSPYEFAGSIGSGTTDAANVIRTAGGGSATLASQFAYNGNPAVHAFHNLVPGREYVATFYTVGWDAAGKTYGRSVTFETGGDMLSVNQDNFGDNVGTRISYHYFAPSSGFLVFSNIPFSTAIGTLHTYGAANYEVGSSNEPAIGVQPASKVSLPGSGAGFYVTAGGARPLGFQWLKDGAVIGNQTNRWLILTNLTGADIAQYSVIVSNAFGMATSSAAGLTFSTSTFANPSFEGENYMTWPGYAAANFPIPGWFVSDPNRVGINLVGGGSPFANNGTPPNGRDAAFLQNAGGVSNSLRTTLQGLTAGQLYTLDFAVNARAGQVPNLHVGVDGQSVSDIRVSSVGTAGFGATGTANPFKRVAFDFMPANSSVLLGLTNDQAGDTTVLLDDFHINISTTKWSFAAWTNDDSSGVDGTKYYTHAYNFGTTSYAVINGIVFKGTSGLNPSVPGQFTTAGFGSIFNGDANAITANGGGGAALATNFLYGGPVQSITLNGLNPGTEYIFTVYGVGFDARGYGRSATFKAGSDIQTINLDHFGNDVGNRVSYRYVAGPSGSITFTYEPTDAGSTFHTYGFANYQVTSTAPIIGAQPRSTIVAQGETATLFVGVGASAQPTTYLWQLDGVDQPDQTNSVLVLSNLTTLGTGLYRVIITNPLGTATSVVAAVEVGVKIPELFHTGVDDRKVLVPGGSVDLHYQLSFSADQAFPGPDAIVMFGDAYPVGNNTYISNGPLSQWISPRTNSSVGNEGGAYVYRTAWILDTVDPAHVQINGLWASDNDGVDIRVNGVSAGVSNYAARSFAAFSSFTLTSGFVAGSNVIDFVITNAAAGPTALRVEVTGAGRPLPPMVPQIIDPPHDLLAVAGTDVTLGVLAHGSGPLHYQWAFEGIPIDGETNRLLRFPDVTLDQAGNYSVEVSNDQGATNSELAVLTVVMRPTIITSPSSQEAACGEDVILAVEYDGTQPITFQWSFNGNPLPGETSDVLVVTNMAPVRTGSYRVTLTGPGGVATSDAAILTLADAIAPLINGATNITVCTSSNGAVVNFSITGVDNCDPNPTVVCVPASGSVFPLGTNTVNCAVYDANHNTNTTSFTVVVLLASQPQARNMARSGGAFTFEFQSDPGCGYRIEYTDSLSSPVTWTPLTTIIGDGSVRTVTDPNATGSARFYRIAVQ